MITLKDAILGTGMLPVEAVVQLDNFALPFLKANDQGKYEYQTKLNSEVLRPWDSQLKGELSNQGAKISLLYFWNSTCENCRDGLLLLDSWARNSRLPVQLQIKLIAYDEDTSDSVADIGNVLKLTQPLYIDESGGIAERLAVLGSPGVVLLDEVGRVVGRLNGDVDFESPNFELFLGRLALEPVEKGQLPFHQKINSEVKLAQPAPVSILGVPVNKVFFVGILFLVCYCIWKFTLSGRKLKRRY